MHQNRQKSVKTSELEDRYAVIFSLALWPEEPREIDFFKKSWFSKIMSSRNVKKYPKWSWNGSPWLRLGWYLAKMDPNASRKPLEALPGPGEAIFDQFWPKRTKNGPKKKSVYFPYIFPYFSPYEISVLRYFVCLLKNAPGGLEAPCGHLPKAPQGG